MSSGTNLELKNFVLHITTHLLCVVICVVTCVIFFGAEDRVCPSYKCFVTDTPPPHPFSTFYLKSGVLTLSLPWRGLSWNIGILNTNTCIVRRSLQPSDLTFTAGGYLFSVGLDLLTYWYYMWKCCIWLNNMWAFMWFILAYNCELWDS